jgi:RHS repeat-associated protein
MDGAFEQWYAYGNYIDEVLIKGTTNTYTSFKYYIHDHLYSPVAMASYFGVVQERYEYDAYGKPHVLDPTTYDERPISNSLSRYLFTGRELEILDYGSLKIQYNRNRYYDSYTGRWTTQDPLGITPNQWKANRFAPVLGSLNVIGCNRNTGFPSLARIKTSLVRYRDCLAGSSSVRYSPCIEIIHFRAPCLILAHSNLFRQLDSGQWSVFSS